jgi:hypothetical protein
LGKGIAGTGSGSGNIREKSSSGAFWTKDVVEDIEDASSRSSSPYSPDFRAFEFEDTEGWDEGPARLRTSWTFLVTPLEPIQLTNFFAPLLVDAIDGGRDDGLVFDSSKNELLLPKKDPFLGLPSPFSFPFFLPDSRGVDMGYGFEGASSLVDKSLVRDRLIRNELLFSESTTSSLAIEDVDS